MKASNSLIETFFAIILMGVIVANAMLIYRHFHLQQHENYSSELIRLELRNTQLFLQNNIEQINSVTYVNNTLYFENALLLQNVSKYNLQHRLNSYKIELCIQKFCEEFILEK